LRLSTFSTKSGPDRSLVGVFVNERMVDLDHVLKVLEGSSLLVSRDMKSLLSEGSSGLRRVSELMEKLVVDQELFMKLSYSLSEINFLPPIQNADKFLCVGKNYKAHLEELKRTNLIKEVPNEPTGFIKINDCLVGHDCDVERPESVVHLDYEPELVFVIGKPAYQIKAENAFNYVAGITILNDLTCRDTQMREVASGSRFWTSKNAPGFGPLGPYIITMDEVPDPYDIWVTCSVNGEQRMRVNTSDQIWKLPRILEHFSRLVPLMPGDMFSTGAPGGVAVGKPNAEELYLNYGDIVECAFERPNMVLRTRIVAPNSGLRKQK